MEFDMTYNTQEANLVIAEYGRHIQNLVEFNKTIENDKERQEFAEQVIELMHQMNPSSKTTPEYKNKLWKHFFMIADYDINVSPPGGEVPKAEDRVIRPEIIEYPSIESEFRHYGHNVRLLMEKAIAMEDGPVKDGFVETIASFMKLAYKNWNREHYVSDEIILEDLKSLSKGKLSVAEDKSLDTLTSAVKPKKRRSSSSSNNSNNRRRNSRNNRRRR